MGLKRNGEGDRVLGVRFNMAGNGLGLAHLGGIYMVHTFAAH